MDITRRSRIVADVKCYFCGHISGQVEGIRGSDARSTHFQPRHGFTGVLPQPGARLRCERCGGPTFLEDVTPMTAEDSGVLGRRHPARVTHAISQKKAA